MKFSLENFYSRLPRIRLERQKYNSSNFIYFPITFSFRAKKLCPVFQNSALSDIFLPIIYPIPSTVDQKCLGENTNQLQGKNYKVKIQTKYKRE